MNSVIDNIIDCFDAAFFEGLQEALNETQDLKLKDLVERRILFALYYAQEYKEYYQSLPSNHLVFKDTPYVPYLSYKCLVCGEYHDNGNLPCPYSKFTSGK